MINERHLDRLQRLYAEAPSSLYETQDLSVSAGQARIAFQTEPEDLDAAGIVDRALYFKLLSDAAALAAGSLVEDHHVLCETFDLYVTRSVKGGELGAIARVVSAHGTIYTVESVLVDAGGHKVAAAHGVFARSPIKLSEPSDVQDEAKPAVAYGSLWESPFGFIHQN